MTSREVKKHPLIHPDFLGVLSLSDNDRLKFIDEERWIGYRAAKNVLSSLETLMNTPKRARMPNLLIVGDPNNGKTHILNQFLKQCGEPYVNDNVQPVRPVVIVQAPPAPDEKALLIQILERFVAPYRHSDTVLKLRHQAIHMLRYCNVKLLIIDEVHSMLSGSSVSQRQVMTSIKYLCNELMMPIVCAGTRSAVRMINQDPQHASRFEAIALEPWPLDSEFRKLVNSFEMILPLKGRSNLQAAETTTLLHEISQGNIGNLHDLLKRCAKHAINSGAEIIDVATIREHAGSRSTQGVKFRSV